MDVVGQDRDGKKISDVTRLFRLPVKNKVHCMRSLKVQVKIMLTELIESNFFTSSGLMHPISTSTVLLRTGSDSEITRLLSCQTKKLAACRAKYSVSCQTENHLKSTNNDEIKACELD